MKKEACIQILQTASGVQYVTPKDGIVEAQMAGLS